MSEITHHQQTNLESLPRLVKSTPLDNLIKIEPLDEKDSKLGGAHHAYQIYLRVHNEWHKKLRIDFHKGGLGPQNDTTNFTTLEANGISIEALLAVCIDRLQGFQSGEFSCRENALALTNIEQAMLWLFKRTNDRVRRDVEGKLVK